MQGSSNIPHLRIVVWFSIIAILGYAVFSVWTFIVLKDASMVGDVIGTWKSFGVLAFGFWLGSSSGGKALTGQPQEVKVTNDTQEPLPVKETTNNARD